MSVLPAMIQGLEKNVSLELTYSLCTREEKLPNLELLFIHKQREKIGDKGEIMIAAPDITESQRQTAYQERRLAEELRRERAEENTVTESDELLQRSEEFT